MYLDMSLYPYITLLMDSKYGYFTDLRAVSAELGLVRLVLQVLLGCAEEHL